MNPWCSVFACTFAQCLTVELPEHVREEAERAVYDGGGWRECPRNSVRSPRGGLNPEGRTFCQGCPGPASAGAGRGGLPLQQSHHGRHRPSVGWSYHLRKWRGSVLSFYLI